jgi:hypothetical protein
MASEQNHREELPGTGIITCAMTYPIINRYLVLIPGILVELYLE